MMENRLAASAPVTYTLNIVFTAQDLIAIRGAGESVVILRSSRPGVAVVWAAFVPFQNSVVQWTNSFQVYASGTPLAPGNTIVSIVTPVDAIPQYVYSLVDGAFGTPQLNTALPADQVQIYNDPSNGAAFTFGLSQALTANGSAPAAFCPVSARTVLSGQALFAELDEQLTVMLRSDTTTAEVINYVPVASQASLVVQSSSITLTFSPASATQTIQYVGGGFQAT